jgi:predicted nuclease of predicted toxin-antitoxin system
VIVSADTDFGALLTMRRQVRPSVILLRHGVPRRAADQAALLLADVTALANDHDAGAIIVFHADRIRVRRLSSSG